MHNSEVLRPNVMATKVLGLGLVLVDMTLQVGWSCDKLH